MKKEKKKEKKKKVDVTLIVIRDLGLISRWTCYNNLTNFWTLDDDDLAGLHDSTRHGQEGEEALVHIRSHLVLPPVVWC